jgi:hypothetical protein
MAWRQAGSLDRNALRPLPRDEDGLLSPRDIHNIWFTSGAHDLPRYATLAKGVVRTQQDLVQGRAAYEDLSFDEQIRGVAAIGFLLPLLSDHLILPATNSEPSVRLYVDSLRITMFTLGVAQENKFSLQIDLRRDHLRGVPRHPSFDPAVVVRKIWFGALEGALEHEMASNSAISVGIPASAVTSTSALLGRDGAVVLRPGSQASGALALEPETVARIAIALSSGATLVVPKRALAGVSPAWWEISDYGADTRAVMVGNLNMAIVKYQIGFIETAHPAINIGRPFIPESISKSPYAQPSKGDRIKRKLSEYFAMVEVGANKVLIDGRVLSALISAATNITSVYLAFKLGQSVSAADDTRTDDTRTDDQPPSPVITLPPTPTTTTVPGGAGGQAGEQGGTTTQTPTPTPTPTPDAPDWQWQGPVTPDWQGPPT